MTYDEYTAKVRARMKRLVRAENFIKKYRFLIAATVDILFVAFIFTMYFAGSYIKNLSAHDAVYGEDCITEAAAFLADVKYTYTENGIEQDGLPYGAGTYEIKAETRNPFGVIRSQNAALTIHKRKAVIRLIDFSTEYGSEPDAKSIVRSSDLAEGDTVSEAKIEYDRFEKVSDAKIVSVTITDRYGNDVTSSYELEFKSALATVSPRKITVDTKSAEKKYDGTELKCGEYEITQGSLAYDDTLVAEFNVSVTKPDTVSNRAVLRIYGKDGAEVTEKYTVSERIGSLTVIPLEIKIKTGSAEKEYDGKALECKEYEIVSSELEPGHSVRPLNYPSITDPGTVLNDAEFYIVDENGQNVTDIYEITKECGTLKINPRKITLKSGSSLYEYDGTMRYAPSDVQIVSGELYDNDTLVTYGHPTGVAAGSYKNTFEKDSSNVPDNAYDITYDYGVMTITKKPLSLSVRIYADKDKSDTSFVASLSGTTEKNDDLQNFVYIPVNVPYGDFEEYIRQNVTIRNSILKANVSSSYDITCSIRYDENELDGFRAGLSESTGENQSGHSSGTPDKEKEPHEDETKAEDTQPAIPAEDIYGPSGIGSSGIGGGINNSPSPYSEVPDTAPDPDKTVLGSVSGFEAGAVYLRLRSFGNYTGSGWAEPALYEDKEDKEEESPLNMTYSSLLRNGYVDQNELEIEYRADDGLVPVPYYSFASQHGAAFTMTDVAVPKDNGDDRVFFYRQIPVINTSVMLTLDDTGAVSEEYKTFVYENYLSLPEDTEKQINKIIKQAGLDRTSPTVVQDVIDYVKHAASYSGSFEQIPEGEDRVIYFLTQSKEGVCGHFASAATVIYRALGIPARYTVGYYVMTEGQYKTAEFYAKDAHAWVEIFVDNVGWVPVEVTSSSVAPSGAGSQLQPPDTGSSIFYNKLYYHMESVSKKYDGKELYSDAVKLLSGSNLREGDVIYARTGSIKYTGALSSTAKKFAIYDENGNDVTLLYDVTEIGQATVEIKPLTVDLPDIDIYVGQTVTLPSYADVIGADVAALMENRDIEFEFTSDYSVLIEDGAVTGVTAENDRVFKDPVDLGSNGREHHGYADYNEDVGAEIVFRQKINVLPFENIRIKQEKPPEDQPAQTVIRKTAENGRIYNYISVRSVDGIKSFDGEYLHTDGYEILSGALADGHTLEYASGAYQLYVGCCDNLFSRLCIKDGSGIDVTGEYIIDFYPGTLTVVTGKYGVNGAETDIEVDGVFELDKISWTDVVSNVGVSYKITGDKPIVRVEDGALIGISPGTSHISALLYGTDLNGDGVKEYDDSYQTLTVNVKPKKQSNGAGLYIAFALTIAAAGFAVTFTALRIAAVKKNEAKNGTENTDE